MNKRMKWKHFDNCQDRGALVAEEKSGGGVGGNLNIRDKEKDFREFIWD